MVRRQHALAAAAARLRAVGVAVPEEVLRAERRLIHRVLLQLSGLDQAPEPVDVGLDALALLLGESEG